MIKMLLIFMLLTASFAYADTKLSVMGSLSYNSPELKNDNGIDQNSEIGLGAGLRALMGIRDQLYFRSGAALVQKKVSFDIGSLSEDYSFVYLNIPLTFYWKASSQVGFFGGTALNAKLSDDCNASRGSCNIQGAKSLVLPAVLGFDFSMTEKLGLEVSYEHGLTDVSKNLRIHSLIASVLYHF